MCWWIIAADMFKPTFLYNDKTFSEPTFRETLRTFAMAKTFEILRNAMEAYYLVSCSQVTANAPSSSMKMNVSASRGYVDGCFVCVTKPGYKKITVSLFMRLSHAYDAYENMSRTSTLNPICVRQKCSLYTIISWFYQRWLQIQPVLVCSTTCTTTEKLSLISVLVV